MDIKIKDLLLQLKSSRQKLRNPKGATMIEYVLIATFIAMICLFSIRLLGYQTSATFSHVTSALCAGM